MDDTPCGCRQNCFEAVGDEQRKKIFDNFWKLGSFDVQNAYLVGCVKITEVRRRYSPQSSSRRNYSREYSVRNDAMCSIPVCKTAFLRIHGVSNGRLSRIKSSSVGRGNTSPRSARETPPGKQDARRRD